jgi:hypothetical protein
MIIKIKNVNYTIFISLNREIKLQYYIFFLARINILKYLYNNIMDTILDLN